MTADRPGDARHYDAVTNFHQPKNGYRFSADSLHLARFVDLKGVEAAADFGAGCGIVGLGALEYIRPGPSPARFFFVERQAELFACLDLNLDLYRPRTPSRLTGLKADWRELEPADFGGPLDYVMVNPPYFPLKSSRPSPDILRDEARREIHGGLAELAASLARLIKPGGRAALVLPFSRGGEAVKSLAGWGFSLRRAARVSGGSEEFPARLVLLEAVKSSARG